MVLRLQWCSLYLLFLCSIDFRMGTKLMWWSCAEVLISQAFDTVPHRELLARSVGYGCHQKIINWLANYLSDRKQSVNSFEGLLLPLPINQGIIQGSGIGPCCFLAYIADLRPKHTDTVYCKFADDLTAIIREDSRATDKIKHIVEWYLSMLYFCKSSCSSHCTLTIFIWQTPLVILLVAVWQLTDCCSRLVMSSGPLPCKLTTADQLLSGRTRSLSCRLQTGGFTVDLLFMLSNDLLGLSLSSWNRMVSWRAFCIITVSSTSYNSDRKLMYE